MKNLLLKSIAALCTLLASEQSFSLQLRTLDYEAVREEGGFNAESLKNVGELIPGGRNLSKDETLALVTSNSLTSLKILDLKNQPTVNDEVIKQLANNPTFSRIVTLKLRGTDITDESIEYILNSEHLGSIRDRPSISGKYGTPYSMIIVFTKDTFVKDITKRTRFDFHIEYRAENPTFFTYPWEPVDHAVKFVEIETW
jgi:hypothetical protein